MGCTIGYKYGFHFRFIVHCLHHHLLVQTGAVCVFLQDQGKFDLQMTAGVHARTFAAFRKEGILHPSEAAYRQHFSRMWDEGMSAHNAELVVYQ